MLHLLYPLRRCSLNSKKPCLYFHINQCLGFCAGKTIDYQPNINAIINFLKGNTKNILNKLNKTMRKASEKMLYEKAKKYQDIIEHIQTTTKKQIINNQKIINCDVLAYVFNQDQIAIQILKIQQGNIVDSYHSVFSYIGYPQENINTYLHFYYQNKIKPELIITGINELINKDLIQNKETQEAIYFCHKLLANILKTKIVVAQRGNKKKIYLLALKNAQNYLEQNITLLSNKK
ncbi:UvrB/UvrC motif-containing protein ['Fragaria x ananassa' phyllody phytoplasma]|uniref:UvrB/UvrC motif-containing protein n=1 Tax='Fragaria x ananassa' phyllody phytoplasma TaxID=2358428 RepID=UPI001CED20C4|nr:UvrB/UvrC motif-containing protein ['Fragaria x ananassa' phyllody phytoplasma]